MKKQLLLLPVLSCLLVACAVTTPSQRLNEPSRYETLSEYIAWLETIENDLRDGEPRELSDREWQKFDQLMARTRELHENYDRVSEMSEEDQMAAFNTHEELTTLVIGDGRNPVSCRMEHRTGTHFKEMRCRRRGHNTTDANFQEWWHRRQHTIGARGAEGG